MRTAAARPRGTAMPSGALACAADLASGGASPVRAWVFTSLPAGCTCSQGQSLLLPPLPRPPPPPPDVTPRHVHACAKAPPSHMVTYLPPHHSPCRGTTGGTTTTTTPTQRTSGRELRAMPRAVPHLACRVASHACPCVPRRMPTRCRLLPTCHMLTHALVRLPACPKQLLHQLPAARPHH